MYDLSAVYKEILHDEEWLGWMSTIKDYSATGECQEMYSDHGIRHAMRTAEKAADFVRNCHWYFKDNIRYSFGFTRDFYLSAIASLLHDIGIVEGRKNHAQRSREMAKTYLQKFELYYDDILLISGAVGSHNGNEPIVNLIDAAVLMGDKLDIIRDRILAFYDKALTSALSPLQKALLRVKSSRYFINEVGHGVLEWGLIPDPTIKDFDDDAKRLIDLAMQEWPKCITIPEKITNQFLNIPFSFAIIEEKNS